MHIDYDSKISGNPGRTRMFTHLCRTYYWLLMATDVVFKVRLFPHGTSSCIHLILWKQSIRLIITKNPLEAVVADLMGPLPKKWAIGSSSPWWIASQSLRKSSHWTESLVFAFRQSLNPISSASNAHQRSCCPITSRSWGSCSTKLSVQSSAFRTDSGQIMTRSAR